MSDEKRVYIDPSVLSNLAIESMLHGQTPTTDPSRAVFPSGPEPDRVYGYVAFVDPMSGAEHLPRRLDGLTNGYPGNLVLRFVNPAGETLDLTVPTRYLEAGFGADGAIAYRGPNSATSVAWYYDIQLRPDQSLTGPPTPWPDATVVAPRTALVTYNPDTWRFLELVSIGGWHGRGDSGQPIGPVAFNRRSGPFPDLPDNP